MNKEITLHNSSEFQNSTITDRFGRVFNYLRIAINERCNLRCIYCMPEEGILFQEKDRLLDKNEICKIIKVMSELGVSKIRFTGGEPLMIQEQFDLLESAVKNGHSKNIKVHYNTNGTHYVKNAVDNIWPNFKTIEFAFSIDDVGDKFEYQRYGAKWDEVNTNITNYHALANESWFSSQVCMTFSAFNILSVPELLEWVDTQPFGHVYFNLMHDPKHFNMKVLPDPAKEKIATRIIRQTENTKYYDNVKNLCNFLLQKDNEIEDNKDKYWADFKRHLLQTDKFRNQNFADTFPDLYVLIEEWL